MSRTKHRHNNIFNDEARPSKSYKRMQKPMIQKEYEAI